MKALLRLTKGPLEWAVKNVRQSLPIILSAMKTKMKMLLKGVLLSTIFSVTLSFTAIAQPAIVWDKTFGGIPIPGSQNDRWGGDRLKSVISTGNGGYLLGGTSSSNINGDKSELCRGANDYWIVKINAHGNKLWDKTFGGFLEDELSSIVTAPDGGYLLAGTSSSPVSGDKTAPGATDYWVVKVDGQGNKLWDKTFGSNGGLDRLSNAIAIPGGGYLLGGTSQTPGADYFVVRIDNQGNKSWDKPFGGDSDDFLSTVTLTPDGFLLSGFSNSGISGDKSEAGAGTWLVKIDNQGNKVWDKTLGGTGVGLAALTADGGYLLAGNSRIIKIDGAGNIVWDKNYGGNLEENFTSIVSVPDGGYLLTGTLTSAVTSTEFWVIKIDNQGNKVWDKTIGGSGVDLATSSVVAPNGNYLVAGFSNSNASGDKSENSKGGFDYWIVALKVPPVTTSLTLINARTDQEIKELKDGDVINLKEVGSRLLDIRANIAAEKISKVVFDLKGPIKHHQVERTSPYALFGDHQGDFNGRRLLTGEYTLTVTPFIEDNKAASLTISFAVTAGFAISGFTLIDATLDQPIGPLSDGDVIDLTLFKGHKLSVRADTEPNHVDNVVFILRGPITYFWIERYYPYTLFGDITGQNGSTDYAGLNLFPGTYKLTATPYDGGVLGSPQSITFEVIRGGASEAARQVEVYPIPASQVINIKHEGKTGQSHMILVDFNGNVLLHRPLSPQPAEQLDVSAFRKGVYYLKIVSPEGLQIIRLVIE